MVKPVISIIMPVYNAERYIGEAIESVFNQIYQKWELIIINDGSIDDTVKVIESFSDERIVLLEQNNRGVSAARNAGLDIAKGKYITFLDADDVLPSNSLEERVNYLESNSEVDIVDGFILVKDENMDKVFREYSPYYHGELLPRLLALDSQVFFNVCYMFGKSILGDTQFNEKMTHAEDLLFYMELSSKNKATYGYVKESIYYYRQGNDSAMMNLDGLEAGYLLLIKNSKLLKGISLRQIIYLKLRISRIMFLSRLRNKNYIQSINSLIKVLFT